MSRAGELLYTGDVIDAATAREWGLVSYVVGPDALMDEAMKLAERIAQQPPHALRLSKALLKQGQKRLEMFVSFFASSRDTLPSLLASRRFIDDAAPPLPDIPLLSAEEPVPAEGVPDFSVPAALTERGSANTAATAAAIRDLELSMVTFLSQNVVDGEQLPAIAGYR